MCDREPSLIYAGTYQAAYPRNSLMIEAFRRAGFVVLEINEPVWERATIILSGRAGGGDWFGWSRLRLAVELLVAYPRLVWRVAMQLPHMSALVVGYPGQIDMLVLGPLAKLMRKPVIFNPLVTLTDMIVEDRELVPGASFLGRCIHQLDRLALRLADRVIVDTAENRAYIIDGFGVPAEKIAEIPVGADSRVFEPDPNPMKNCSTSEPLRVLFYGKYIPLHGIETILRAARILQDLGAAVDFELVGDGQTRVAIGQLADELGLRNLRFVESVPYHELPNRIASADIVLGIFGETTKAGRVIPNKVFQAMAMGAAIITRHSPAVERVLRHGESALLVRAGSPDELADAILDLRDERRRASLGRVARASYERLAGPDVLAEMAGKLVRQLLSGDEPAERQLEISAIR